MSIIDASQALAMGIRNNFVDTWKPQYDGIMEALGGLVEVVPSDKIEEKYAAFETAPFPRRLDRGDGRRAKGFNSYQYTIENLDWDSVVGWHANDAADDQTNSQLRRARDAGTNFATLHERVVFQILNGSADADLLPNIPLDPYGDALFVTTHKFGSNLLAGAGTGGAVGTAEEVRTDLYKAIAAARNHVDTEGQPLIPNSLINQSVTILAGADFEQEFRKAFEQSRTIETTAGGATTNIIMDSGLKIRLFLTQRIPNNDWFVNFDGTSTKPIVIQERQGLREITALMTNDAEAKRTKEEGVFWDARYGYGLNPPYGLFKINNAA